MNEPNRKLTFVMRIILAAWGLILGWWFAGFIMGLYPDYFNPIVNLVVRIVNSVLFGVICATLAKPVSAFAIFCGRGLKLLFVNKPLYVTGSFVLGIVIGIMLGVLANAIVELFTDVFAARFIIDLSVAALGTYAGYLGCRKWLVSAAEQSEEKVVIEYSGYILTYGAFFSDKLPYVTQLINGKIFILGKTLRRLIALAGEDVTAKAALDNYLKLSEYASVKILDTSDEREETEEIIELAENKLLKIIAINESEIKTERNVKVLSLSEL